MEVNVTVKKIRDTAMVPKPGYFIFVNPEDKHKVTSHTFMNLVGKVKEYRKANNYPIGLGFNEWVEANVCEHAPGICIDFVPPSITDKAAHLTVAIANFARNGFKTTTDEQYNARLAVCEQCNFYGGFTGNIKIACGKCGCSKVKLAWVSEKCPLNKWPTL